MNSVQDVYNGVIRVSHNFLVSIKRHKLVFLVSILIGLAPAILMYTKDLNGYEASFTVSYDELVRKIYGDRLKKINSLVHQHDYNKVATFLDVDKNVAKSLISVKGTNILGEDLSKDMNTDKIPFIVNIMVKDSSYLRTLQNGIVRFLEYGNDYMVDKNKIKRKEITDELAFIDQQLNIMDSLKRGMTDKSATAGNDKEGNGMAPVFQFSYELYKKRQDLQRKKELVSSLQVVDDAIVSKNTTSSLAIYVAGGLILGFIVYIIVIGFILPVINYKEEKPL